MISPTELFNLLSDQTRLRCMLLLSKEKEICVCEFSQILKSIQPKISRHLAYLRKSGLVLDERKEQWVYYRLSHDLTKWTKQIILNISNELNEEEPYKSDFRRINILRKQDLCTNTKPVKCLKKSITCKKLK
ncbi:MAG: HTH-type transcriptional repressor AseR [Candidatus Anoxychlamydiales bacterium]|uniref:HTH arsR-type domain-containing protein n=1 Tax=marine sediment metagenome TaxID=412755 RepID=A0A0F9E6B3_9ZZZZ|nr:HTH-type transcriptional repressor AseR [Candidatus Anoxychlamydiales bacterium]NGX41721.1 HTH-type transcriptional repressor AseR [Candidatus Anoxychlamydiales bacterium]